MPERAGVWTWPDKTASMNDRALLAPGGAPLALDRRRFALDVAEYLTRAPRQLPSRYFYDGLGSALFEAICRLPWYRVTRAESSLIAAHAEAMTMPCAQPLCIAELGCGSGEKLETLLDASRVPVQRIVLIDVSSDALQEASGRLSARAVEGVVTHCAPYDEGLRCLAADRRAHETMLVLFLGSNIGNFDPPVGQELLASIHGALRAGDSLLLGSDLVKPERDLVLAYDDPLRVTAAFNLNLLRRINDELGGAFDLDAFAHRAIWNAAASRVEMHLVSLRRQEVHVAAANLTLQFEKDEYIWTESSYKFEPEQIVADGLAAGFSRAGQWVDQDARFAVTRLDA